MMPRRTHPASRRPRDPRPVPQRLLAAALDLVRSEGLQALSQARVAAAAGVRQSHLTYYFPTRQDLLKALVRAVHAERLAALGAVAPATARPRPSEIREFLARRMREPLLARLMLAITYAAQEDPSLRRWLARFDAEAIERLRELFARLHVAPSDEELALFHASLVGAAVQGAQLGTRAAADRTARIVRLAFDRLLQATRPNRRWSV